MFPGEGHWVRTFQLDPATGDTLDTLLHSGNYMNLEFAHGLPPADPEPVMMPVYVLDRTDAAGVVGNQTFLLNGVLLSSRKRDINGANNAMTLRRHLFTNRKSAVEKRLLPR
jgi:hypothetical protein